MISDDGSDLDFCFDSKPKQQLFAKCDQENLTKTVGDIVEESVSESDKIARVVGFKEDPV